MRTHFLPSVEELQQRYGSGAASRLYLIRPDGYVGFRCTTSELPRLQQYLEELT